MNKKIPILFSFRRCPYAMRARIAIKLCDLECEIREINLRLKNKEFLRISPKGTVPVLVLPDDKIIEESMDIVHWAIKTNDPYNLKCNDFSYVKKIKERSFDIAPLIDEETDSIINQGQFFDPEKDKNNTNLNDTELTEEIDNMFSNQLPE